LLLRYSFGAPQPISIFNNGMMGPTLFDVAAFIGLKPDSDIIDPLLEIPITDTFDKTTTSFSLFIEVFHKNEPEV